MASRYQETGQERGDRLAKSTRTECRYATMQQLKQKHPTTMAPIPLIQDPLKSQYAG
jgi:hypothetical protein